MSTDRHHHYSDPAAGERFYPVRVIVSVEFQTTSTQPTEGRRRGDRNVPHESDPGRFRVALTRPVSYRRRGEEGLLELARDTGHAILRDPAIREHWSRIPRNAARAPV